MGRHHVAKFSEEEGGAEFDAMGPRAVSSNGGGGEPQGLLRVTSSYGGRKEEVEEERPSSHHRLVGTGEVDRVGSSYGTSLTRQRSEGRLLKRGTSNYFGSAHALATGSAPPSATNRSPEESPPESNFQYGNKNHTTNFSGRRGSAMPDEPEIADAANMQATAQQVDQALRRRSSTTIVNDKTQELLHKQDLIRQRGSISRPTTRDGAGADDSALSRPTTSTGAIADLLRPTTNGGLRPSTNGGMRPGTNSGMRPMTGDGTINLAPTNPFNRPKTREALSRLGTANGEPAPSGRLGDNTVEQEGRQGRLVGKNSNGKKNGRSLDDSKEGRGEDDKSDDEAVCCF